MHHCIVQGAYDDLLDDPDVRFFSVRNENREPPGSRKRNMHQPDLFEVNAKCISMSLDKLPAVQM